MISYSTHAQFAWMFLPQVFKSSFIRNKIELVGCWWEGVWDGRRKLSLKNCIYIVVVYNTVVVAGSSRTVYVVVVQLYI